jgi:gamma-glutamylaminecyclotransferase
MAFVFVYGTLKRGGENHRVIAGQRFVGEARTEAAFRLYQLDGYPGMAAVAEGGRSIEGELWEVDGPALARLDELEGTESGLYVRAPLRLLPPHAEIPAETYLYGRSLAGRPDLGVRYN